MSYPSTQRQAVSETQCTRIHYITRLLLELSGAAVAQLLEALRYKLAGRGFDSR
jgi:hypothetical protein